MLVGMVCNVCGCGEWCSSYLLVVAADGGGLDVGGARQHAGLDGQLRLRVGQVLQQAREARRRAAHHAAHEVRPAAAVLAEHQLRRGSGSVNQ